MCPVIMMVRSFPKERGRTESSRAKELLRKADDLCDQGKFHQAVELYDLALDIDASEIIYNNKGVALDSLEEHESAVESYDMAIGLSEDYMTAWHNKANSLVYMGLYEEAIECYDKVISLEPGYNQTYFDKAEAYIKIGNYSKAKKAVEEGVNKGEGERVELLLNKGKILNDIGDHKGALEVYDEAIDLDENNLELWKFRADTLLNLGLFKEANETYDDIMSSTQDEELWNNKGYVLFSTGNYPEAVKCYKRSLDMSPEFGPAHYNLAYLYHTTGEYREAVKHYKEAAKTDPKNQVLWNNLGNALYNMGRYEDSLPYFLKATESNPEYHIAWNNIGNVLDKLGDYDSAVKYHEKAIKLSPNMDYYHYALGHALAKTGKMEEGLEEVNISLDLNPNYENALYVKADILRMLGRVDECLDTIDEIIRVNPRFAKAWEMRGNTLEEHGKYEESRLSFEEALKAYEKNFISFNERSALISKGALLEELGRYEEALETYERLLEEPHSDVTPWVKKISMLLELNDHRQAVVTASRALEEFDDPRLLILKGKGYQGIGNHEKAEIYFRKAYEVDGADARIALARLLGDRGEYSAALEIIRGDGWEERLLRGNIQLERGHLVDAELTFRELVDERVSSLQAWFGLGNTLSKKGEVKEAMKAFDTCIGIREDFEPAWYHKALLYMKQGKEKKAMDFARKAISLANGVYRDAERLVMRLEGKVVDDDTLEEEFREKIHDVKVELAQVRGLGVNITPVKLSMKKTMDAAKAGDYQRGLELCEGMLTDMDRIRKIHLLSKDVKILLLKMKESGSDYGEYVELLKGVKVYVEQGNYMEAHELLITLTDRLNEEAITVDY